MKEHVQEPGVRKYAGDDLIELQSEPLKAIQTLFKEYPPCVVQGCEIEELAAGVYTVKPGLLSLKGVDAAGLPCHKLVPFQGATDVVLPAYFTLTYETQTRVYGDGKAKPIAYNYKAILSVVAPAADIEYLQIASVGAPRWVDVLGVTKKLDREGGQAKDVVVNYATPANRNLPASGAKLGVLLGLITKWFTDLKALAFKEKVEKADLDAALQTEVDNKVVKIEGKGLSVNDYTQAEKDEVNKISGKVDKVTGKGLSANDYTTIEKEKLATLRSEFIGEVRISSPGSGNIYGKNYFPADGSYLEQGFAQFPLFPSHCSFDTNIMQEVLDEGITGYAQAINGNIVVSTDSGIWVGLNPMSLIKRTPEQSDSIDGVKKMHMAEFSSVPGNIFAITNNGGIYISTNHGENWRRTATVEGVFDFAIIKRSWIECEDVLIAISPLGVYRSINPFAANSTYVHLNESGLMKYKAICVYQDKFLVVFKDMLWIVRDVLSFSSEQALQLTYDAKGIDLIDSGLYNIIYKTASNKVYSLTDSDSKIEPVLLASGNITSVYALIDGSCLYVNNGRLFHNSNGIEKLVDYDFDWVLTDIQRVYNGSDFCSQIVAIGAYNMYLKSSSIEDIFRKKLPLVENGYVKVK